LNIGFDSMVFLDDNPYERDIVKNAFPEIVVPELPEDPAEYLPYLRGLNLFETASFSGEDAERTRQYQEESKRIMLKQSVSSEEDYLTGLNMQAEVKAFDTFNTPRVAQLTQRSNQFNLRTVRYSDQEIASISTSPDYATVAFSLKDRFGDHGLIAALILRINGHDLFIDTWVMSCRVLKRGMEQFIINEIADLATEKGLSRITGEYLPTEKNGIVKDLFASLNFKQSVTGWELDLSSYSKFNTHINATR
jgi:FkbH-like protein